MKLKKLLVRVLLVAIVLIQNTYSSLGQNGDQILDGVGETDMLARYLFDGNAKDWSRNNLHGSFQSGVDQFVHDNQFGKVLSLTGQNNSFISLPGACLSDIESLSISVWIFLRSEKPGQIMFDFGLDSTNHFFVAPAGTKPQQGLQAIISSKKKELNIAATNSLELNKWIHLAFVVDIYSKTLITYVNSKPVHQTKDIPSELSEVFGPQAAKRTLFIGKSFTNSASNLNAMLHDFRLYRVSLTASQVAGIYRNALRGPNEGSVNTDSKQADILPQFPSDQTKLFNAYLVEVPSIKIETTVGNLPRLPAFIPATYSKKIKVSKVRVLWPEPVDNSSVLQTGTYTITGRIAGTSFQPKAIVTVKNSTTKHKPVQKLEPFHLNQVSLNNNHQGEKTKFIENRDKFINTLAQTDPNSFLYMFRHAYGQPQPEGAIPLGVWDSKDTKLRGHATGHYLTAIAQAYSGTINNKLLHDNFYKKMEYMVNTLYDLSQLSGNPKTNEGAHVSDPAAVPFGPDKTKYDSDLSDEGIRTDYWNWGKGFISAYPPDQFIMLEKGAKYGGQNNQIWAPYYTLHKILAGLMDIYELSGNKKALSIASGMGDWVYGRLKLLPTDTLIAMWNTYIAGEFGGMNEAMARLYRITDKQEHLKTAQLFDNIRIFFGDKTHVHGLAKNVDIFRGLHANQHIPQIVGSLETYRATKNPDYYQIADNFWYKVVNDYTYSIGGVAGARNPTNAECFISQPATLYENGFSSGGQNETCATYNMLKLTGELFLFDQQAQYMDYYERALYNDILASVAEHSPANTYHISLRPGSFKQFGNPDMTGFTCCNGTALESSTKLQNSIYFKSGDNKSLYVNLYIPSTLDWTERNIKIEQTTNFPKEDHTHFTIRGNGQFDIYMRVPGWATKGFTVTINGKNQNLAAKPGSYLKISRHWKNGDELELRMPFQFHLDPVMDQPNIASLFYGPVLLAAQEAAPRSDWRRITLDAEDLGKSIKGDPKKLEFFIGDSFFKPFNDTNGRHSVYLNVQLK